jgi:transposase
MLRPEPLDPVPTETARIARAAFPKGHPYLRIADGIDDLFTDELFISLFPTHGQPAFAPWRLALVTILQFAEGLSDRGATDAVRSRIDWKYVLRLELTDPGFHASVLSEFRSRLIGGSAEYLLFDTVVSGMRAHRLPSGAKHIDGEPEPVQLQAVMPPASGPARRRVAGRTSGVARLTVSFLLTWLGI